MRTQSARGALWLERRDSQAGTCEPVAISLFPFVIGRADSANLKLDQSGISRVHASIVRDGDGLRVRDLGSTNGTMLNGKRVRDWPLSEGDVLAIAGIELVFHQQPPQHPSRTTRAESRDDTLPSAVGPAQLAKVVSRLNERAGFRGLGNAYQPIVVLRDGDVWGYEPSAAGNSSADDPCRSVGGIAAADNLVQGRTRRVQRLTATEEMRARFPDRCLLMVLTAREIAAAGELLREMRHLSFIAPCPTRLVLGFPAAAIGKRVGTGRICQSLHSLGVRIAYVDLADDRQLDSAEPDETMAFLRLAPVLVRGIHELPDRQKRVRAIVEAAGQYEAKVIARGVFCEQEAEMCLQLGCHLAQASVS